MKYFSILFLVFIIAVIFLADMGELPRLISDLYDFPNGDKVGHFILFGLLDFFLVRAFFSFRFSKSRGWVTVAISLVLALCLAIEEWSQQFFPTRTLDLFDLLASYLGMAIGGWVAWGIKK